MRFAIATAGLLLASCDASTDEAASANNEMQNIESKHAVKNKILSHDKTHTSSQKGMRYSQLLQRRLASNKKKRELKVRSTKLHENESLPKSNIMSPDLGILGGQNLKKIERNLRVTGFAIPRAEKESIMDRDSMRESSDGTPVNLSLSNSASSQNADEGEIVEVSNVYSSFMLDNLQYTCDYAQCDCENFDAQWLNGTIECENYVNPDGSDYCESTINYCGEAVEICYRTTLSFEATDSETYSFRHCYTNSKPYQQNVCISFDHIAQEENSYEFDMNVTTTVPRPNEVLFTIPSSNPCTVQFNNMECNSCSTEIRTLRQYSTNEETGEREIIAIAKDLCFNIDCSNAGGEAAIINTCRDDPFPNTLRQNVMFGDDCTRCQPCGLGYRIQNLDAEGYFPVIGEYMCSGLELAARLGFFDRDVCPEIQVKTEEYCGCQPIFWDPALAPIPRMGEVPPSESRQTSVSGPSYIPILLPGDTIGDEACDVCGSQTAFVADPGAIVTLPNGVPTSCAALQGAGRLGMFTSEYCRSKVMPLVFRTCGGCFHMIEEPAADPIPILAASLVTAEPTTEDNIFNHTKENILNQTQENTLNQMEDNSFNQTEDSQMQDSLLNQTVDNQTQENILNQMQDNQTEESLLSQTEDNSFNQMEDNIFAEIKEDKMISLPQEDNVTTPPFAAPTTTATTDRGAPLSCRICPEGSELAFPDNRIDHSAVLLSCRDLVSLLALAGPVFTESYCSYTVRAIIDTDCGGCVVVAAAQRMSGRIDGENDQKLRLTTGSSHHSETPEEIDVVSTASNFPNAAAMITDVSSSGSFAGPHRTWMLLATAAMAIPFSFWTSLS